MKIKITPDQWKPFVQAVEMCCKISAQRTTLPILECLLIEARENAVTIRGSNLDQVIEVSIEAEVQGPGAIVIKARDFLNICSGGNSMELSFKKGDSKCFIECTGTFSLFTCDPSEFPLTSNQEAKESALFSQQELSKILRASYAMAAPNPSRPSIQGVCLSLAEREGVATDGRRLSLSSPNSKMKGFGPIIPDVACFMLEGAVKRSEKWEVSISPNRAIFKSENIIFSTLLVEGTFPNFKQVIPEKKFEAVVDKKVFIAAIERVRVVMGSVDSLRLSLSKSSITLAIASEKGEASKTFDLLKPYHDADFSINMASGFLRDAAAAMGSEEISLEFVDGISPIGMRGDMYSLIMPLRMS
jgi:DNA polymerase III subunit beta